jgi:ABC-type transporter Mla subunit MlaD
MVHVFLLISLFSNLNTPSEVSDQPDSEVAKVTSFVEVRFDKAPLVIVGDPVLFNGAVIGNISKIEYDESTKGLTNVSVRLNNEGIPMGDS